jgi:hypothetical protein
MRLRKGFIVLDLKPKIQLIIEDSRCQNHEIDVAMFIPLIWCEPVPLVQWNVFKNLLDV